MIGCTYFLAGMVRNILAASIEARLRAELKADKQGKRDEMASGMKRKTRKRTQTRKRTGPANDRLNLKGKTFVTPVR